MDRTTELALVELRRDGRLSFSEIAHRLGSTRAAIAHRVGPLLASGELRVLAAVHPRVLGLRVLAHVGLRVHGRVDEVAGAMLDLPSAVFVSQTVGPFHVVVELHVRSDEALREQLQRIRAVPGVVELSVTIYQEVLSSFFLGPEPDVTDLVLDEADRAIIALLQQDGRVPLRDLAEAAGLSITGARARLHRLLDSAVMRVGAIGQQAEAGRALIVGLGASTTDASALIELLGARSGLQFMARTIGRFDLVATVPVGSLDDLREVLAAARAAPGALSVEAWLHERIRQERYQFSPQLPLAEGRG
jgi:DNA-binding Lrp family transcriptional regulator